MGNVRGKEKSGLLKEMMMEGIRDEKNILALTVSGRSQLRNGGGQEGPEKPL